uniref:maestro heat-like repeat family member 5 isoform X12 n=1 Tax=Ictidomys tridecemlineatus TaxID=43179 RepID=UPI001A9EF00F|nr:maestro heat-like repeat family member 5 isoform X12 [Ictidomys tridecemlineatus]
MDRQHSEKPRSRIMAGGMPSAMPRNPRISSHVPRPAKESSCSKSPKDRQSQHTTILLCKSRSSQAALMPKEHKMFMEEAYNAGDHQAWDSARARRAICFKMLRDINSSDPLHLKFIIKKVKDMAQGSPYLVMETIHDYFADNPEISNRHKFRLFQVLKNVIVASDVMEDIWKRRFMQLALENMTKSTELEDMYQNAASDVLVALCRHSWPEVAQHLETEFLTGVFPHRSVLYVMGTLSSHEELLNREDRARWETLLAQVAAKSVPFLNTDMWSRELLSALTKPSRTQQEELPEKGIALTVGLAANRHLNDVWAILDQFGRSGPIKWSLHSFSLKDETLKQSFLTANLMLMGAISRNEGAHSYEFSQISELLECLMVLMEKEPQDVLCTESRPQALHIISSLCKMRPPMDTNRKSRLLSTCLRSVFALPLLDALEKHTCLFLEPPNIQTLYSQTTEALDCMLQSFITQSPTAEELHFLLSHLYVWLASEKAHERQRAVHSCVTLLKFLNHKRCLDPKEGLKRIGQLVGMLGILCQDPDRAIQHSSLEGMGHLYQLLMRQKAGETFQVESLTSKEVSQPGAEGAPLWSSEQKATSPDPQELASLTDSIFHLESSQALKEIMRHLLMAEVTDLIWTAISGLGSSSPFRVQAAAELLLAVIHQHGAKLETVANMARGIHLRLCSVRIPQAKDNALSAITLLARNHTPELVAAFLDFSMPLDSHAFRLWRALGAEQPVSRLVLAMLLAWLQERPLPTRASNSNPNPKEKDYLRSLAAMNTLLELQFAREFKKAVREAYPQLLLALLTQVHYTLELNLVTEPQRGQQAQEAAMPSPQSTSLEALKSLLSTTGHWHDFAHLELQGAWEHFTSITTYAQGVGLLARAMVQNHCRQIKAVLSWLLRRMQSQEERERKAAVLVLTEFLYSPVLLEVLPKQSALTLLAQGLRDESPDIRVWSLQGLGNILFHPEKERLLRGQLPPFLNGFFQNSEPVVVDIMGTVSDVLHRLGTHGAGAQSLSVAINARSFFDDERDRIRAAAMALFGDLVATMEGKELSGLRTQVYQSMVPLLLHLKDKCPKVATQAKFAFYRCALLLGWRPRHTLFCTLAWERGLSARHFLWTCLMRASSEEFSIHLAQALSYLHSHHQHMKTWAALFIGYTICYHPQAVSRMVSEVDTNLLFCTFEDLKKDPEPGVREFATRQLSFLREVSEGRQQ